MKCNFPLKYQDTQHSSVCWLPASHHSTLVQFHISSHVICHGQSDIGTSFLQVFLVSPVNFHATKCSISFTYHSWVGTPGHLQPTHQGALSPQLKKNNRKKVKTSSVFTILSPVTCSINITFRKMMMQYDDYSNKIKYRVVEK